MDLIKVLMVDDELIVRNWFTNHIPWGDAGVALIGCAANGQLALQLMEQEIPDIVITDITMPVMNGLDFARNVQALYPKVKIVILTVYSEFAYAQQAVSIGAKEFLLKTELTTEQLLECCGRLAQEIHKEKQEEQRLSGRELNDLEEKWLAKREFVQSMLDDELDSEQYLNEIHANYSRRFTRLSCIWIGWDTFPMMFEKHKTSQQLLDLQREIGQGLLTSQGVDCEIHVYPYRNNRLFIVVKGPTSLSDLHYANYMYHLTLSMLSLADKLTGTESFLYMDLGAFELDRFAKRMNSGLDLLQAYFYQPKAAFQVTDRIDFAEHNARFQAGVVVQTAELFHNEGKGDLDTIVKQLLEVNPPFSPKFLLETAERMMGCLTGERTKRVKFLMECLPLIETIHVYRTWWSEMKQELIRSGSLVEESGMRKEVKQMCKYITKHYSRDLSQKELADVVNLNATYAGKLFKRETGETIPDYINRIRIQEACTFLDQTTMKVYEVASATGFSDYRYFCKVFKHYAGATPSDYKDKQQSKERT